MAVHHGEYDPHETIKRRLLILLYYLVIVSVYLILGGVLMWRFESAHERSLNELRMQYTTSIKLTDEIMHELEAQGLCSFPKEHTLHWTFTGSVFYCLTVITTIGYGVFAPKTLGGRVFTVLYAMLGISVVGLLLSNLAGIMAGLFHSIAMRYRPQDTKHHTRLQTVEEVLTNALDDHERSFSPNLRPNTAGSGSPGLPLDVEPPNIDAESLRHVIMSVCGMKPKHWQDESDGRLLRDIINKYQNPFTGRFTMDAVMRSLGRWYEVREAVPLRISWRKIAVFWTVCAAWVFSWALIFQHVEGWGYFDSVWFSCITLSTIGFGDFTPETMAGRLLCFVFIAPGIGMVAGFITSLTEMFEANRFWALQKAHTRGFITEKFMRAQGIGVTLEVHPPTLIPRDEFYTGGDQGDTDYYELHELHLQESPANNGQNNGWDVRRLDSGMVVNDSFPSSTVVGAGGYSPPTTSSPHSPNAPGPPAARARQQSDSRGGRNVMKAPWPHDQDNAGYSSPDSHRGAALTSSGRGRPRAAANEPARQLPARQDRRYSADTAHVSNSSDDAAPTPPQPPPPPKSQRGGHRPSDADGGVCHPLRQTASITHSFESRRNPKPAAADDPSAVRKRSAGRGVILNPSSPAGSANEYSEEACLLDSFPGPDGGSWKDPYSPVRDNPQHEFYDPFSGKGRAIKASPLDPDLHATLGPRRPSAPRTLSRYKFPVSGGTSRGVEPQVVQTVMDSIRAPQQQAPETLDGGHMSGSQILRDQQPQQQQQQPQHRTYPAAPHPPHNRPSHFDNRYPAADDPPLRYDQRPPRQVSSILHAREQEHAAVKNIMDNL
eukprot:gene5724-8748_t